MKSLKVLNGKGTRPEESLPSLWKNFLENPFRGFFPSQPGSAVKAPVVDISEDDKEMTVKAEIPGMSEKDLELSYLDGVLYLKGEKKEEKETKGKKSTYRESWYGSFTRGIPVGRNVDWKKVQARYKDGVLQVNIPKVPGTENRVKINIQ